MLVTIKQIIIKDIELSINGNKCKFLTLYFFSINPEEAQVNALNYGNNFSKIVILLFAYFEFLLFSSLYL